MPSWGIANNLHFKNGLTALDSVPVLEVRGFDSEAIYKGPLVEPRSRRNACGGAISTRQ